MNHVYDLALLIGTQCQAAMWANEARELLAYLETTPPGPLADYRRARCIVAQRNAATYHEWVAHDLRVVASQATY